MLKIGTVQTLHVLKKVDFGVYLYDGVTREEKVLLPKKQVPQGLVQDDEVTVFLYKDSSDRLIATTNTPEITLDQIALLTVKDIGKIGAFLDWGLEKDLLLPFKEQTYKPQAGEQVLVRLYVDKSERLCASMKLYRYLSTDSPYTKDDRVEGIVYEISDNFGAFVAVDNKYSGLIPKKELDKSIRPGMRIEARVTSVKEDGKLDLSVHEKVQFQISIDAAKIIEYMDANNGRIPFNDKASPEIIRDTFDMSKNEFKRAIGNLLKTGRVEIGPDSIVLKNGQ